MTTHSEKLVIPKLIIEIENGITFRTHIPPLYIYLDSSLEVRRLVGKGSEGLPYIGNHLRQKFPDNTPRESFENDFYFGWMYILDKIVHTHSHSLPLHPFFKSQITNQHLSGWLRYCAQFNIQES